MRVTLGFGLIGFDPVRFATLGSGVIIGTFVSFNGLKFRASLVTYPENEKVSQQIAMVSNI